MTKAVDYSRIVGTAESLGDNALDRHRFLDKSVLLTGDIEFLATPNGRNCFLDSARLLMRMVRNLKVQIPAACGLNGEVAAILNATSAPSRVVVCEPANEGLEAYDAILSVGSSARSDLPWTAVNSNGWTARLSSKGGSLSSDSSVDNPIGALGAACLGAAEVFKRLIRLKPTHGDLQDTLAFSLYSYRPEDAPGPAMPEELPINLLLTGAGAIGNGILHLLRSLPVSGQILIVDGQSYGPENFATGILVEPQYFGVPKALAAEKWMARRLTAKGFHEQIETFKERLGKEFAYPALVINGLDKISARRAVQDIWPDQIIDGAIGATSCEVTLHPWGPDLACLKCDFEEAAVPAEVIQEQATGLRRDRLSDVNSVVNDEDIAAAPIDKREWLRARRGKQICSVISGGVAASMSEVSQPAGFAPSVPFVACLSSCMIVTELVRYVKNWPSVLETGFQFDVMVGPQYGQRKSHARKRNCICQNRREEIELFRRTRRKI